MTKLIRSAAIAALLTGFANTALAGGPGLDEGDYFEATPLQLIEPVRNAALPSDATIAVARLDGGRFIPTPFAEEFDWTMLAKRTGAALQPLSASAHLDYVPEIAFDGHDTDNKIDEIRLAAVNEGYSHVILYGVGPDARWASFGGKALVETGLTVHDDCSAWEQAKAKALLVEARTGEVLGAALADDVEFHIGALADDVERLLGELGQA